MGIPTRPFGRRLAPATLCASVVTLLLALAAPAHGAPLAGSSFDTGDGNQENGLNLDWQNAASTGRAVENADPNAADSCYVGGTKENTPNQWAFNTSAGGCTPGKSNVRAAWANPESTAGTTFSHFAFWRNDTTGNSFLTFELNQSSATWVNAVGTTIPCRNNGDLLLSFESAGGSALATAVYKWTGDGTGPAACPNGASGSFASSGLIGGTNFQGSMNPAAAFNYLNPATHGSSFPSNSFGEAAINLPAVLQGMGESPCFGFLQMQVHSRSSSSISSALIDTTSPTPVYVQSCSATGYKYKDDNANGARDAGEQGLAGFVFYLDLDDDGVKDAGEPSGTSDSAGFYRILNVPAGTYKIREVDQDGWNCTAPSPCFYTRSFATGGNSTGNDFGNSGPSSASGTKFDDLDADGVQDAGESALAGFAFYVDYDDDAQKDANEPSATSDATGAWTISNVEAGTYKIREVAQSGWTCSLPSPCSYTRTFTSGSSAAGLTFGNWNTASVSGNLFEDLDGDGAAKEAGEPNLSGWQVYADANANDAFDFGETATTTDASGNYTLSGLQPGARTIRATLPSSAWYCTRPAQTASACEQSVTLTSGQSSTGQSFAFTRYATVSGTKFDDTSNNGIKDGSESGIAGFVFYVDYDNDDVLDASEPQATSAATTGAWSITGVKAGAYPVREVPQAGWTCTKPASTCRYDLNITSGGSNTGNEFGNHIVRSVSGTVFRDNDADSLAREAGEPGLDGWTVYEDTNNNSVRDAGEPSDVTNSDGFYLLTGLANGSYRLRIVSQAGWTCSFPAECLNTGSLGNSANASDTGKDFGVWGPASISGNLFDDADADGAAKEAGEAGISGRTVYIDSDGDSTLDAGEPSATTNAAGDYTISNVTPGTYTVRQVLPGGWTCSLPSPCSYSVTIAGANVTGKNFGSWTTGTIGGSLYEDRNADGSKGAGEGNLSGQTVYLDLNGNGAKDAGEPETTTDGSGNYSFTRSPGSYQVRAVVAAGWTCSQPSPCSYAVTVTSQSSASARDFGLYTTGAIGGSVYEDSNFDKSVPDAGEPGLSGETVYIDANDDGTLDAGETQTTTDGSGAYSFSGVAPGTYLVRLERKAGWTCPFPSDCRRQVEVLSQTTASGNDFGTYVGAEVAGNVFEDLDADGQPAEAGEAGLEGERVYLDGDFDGVRDADEPTTLTDAAGDYEFTGIEVQTWHVRIDLGSGSTCDSPSPCRFALTLSSGDSVAGNDFGIHAPGSVSGHLYTDRDNDQDEQEFGENDQPGRTVYVDSNDDGDKDAGEPSAVTDGDGNYTLAGLEPGTHSVRQELPADWTCSTPSPCSWLITLTSREAVGSKDFSSFTQATITGYYYEDLNADAQIPDPGLGDPPLAGRTVYVDANGNDSLDDGEQQRTTDGSGYYSFANLAPGTYSIRVGAQPADWTCNYPAACEQTVTVEASETSQQNDFAAHTLGGISGTKFEDLDADGVKDAGEQALAGQVVYLDSNDDGDNDAGEPSATTDASGNYEFTRTPGTYTVRTLSPAGWTCIAPSPCAHTVTVTSSGDHANRDFGMEGPPEIEVTADDKSKVYGEPDPELTWSITSGSLAPGDSLTGVTCDVGNAHTNAGSYAVTCSGNTNEEYVVTYKPGTLTVAARPITVTADDKSKTYGSGDPALTYSITSGSLVDGDSLSGALTRDSGEAAGTYDITRGTVTAGANYDLTFIPGELEVTKRAITVTANDKSKTYGANDPALTYDITAGALVDGDTLSGTLTRDSGESVGAYDITQGTLSADSNYDLTFAPGELEITKRALTVAAADKSKVYGGTDPALTYAITAGALVDGDTLSGSLTRDSGENVAAYAITRGTLSSSGNYDLTFLPGELQITKRPLTVTADDKSKVYGEGDPTLTYAITAGSLADGDSLSGALTRDPGQNVGTYDITRGTLDAGGNYDITLVPGELAITPKPITVTADDKSKVEGDDDPDFTWSITSAALEPGDDLASITCGVAGAHDEPDAYDITCSGSNGNYDVTYETGELTVTAKPEPQPEPEPEPEPAPEPEPTPGPKPPTIGDPVLSPKPTGGGTTPGIDKQKDPETGEDIYLISKSGPCVPLQLDIPIDAEPGDVKDATLTFVPADGGDAVEITLRDAPPEPADGVWSGTLECAADGDLTLEITTTAGTTAIDVGQIVLIDPSGTIYDEQVLQAVGGDPEHARCAAALGGATVRLQRRVDGEFVDVEAGDEGIRPSLNPQISAEDGAYRWDVSAGRYRVLVSKEGYYDATSRVVTVPPPVLDLHVGMKRKPGTAAPEPHNCGEAPEADTSGGCVNRPALAWVRGNEIRKVVFYLDGRRIKTVKRTDRNGRFGVRIDRKRLSPGKHRVHARVIFKRRAHRRPAHVRLVLRRCLENPAPKKIETTSRPSCKPFLAFVRGDKIKVVAYSLDGRRLGSVRIADWDGRYAVSIDPRELRPGRHTLAARIVFVDKSGLAARTVKLSFSGCRTP
jgi:hypothetical protein